MFKGEDNQKPLKTKNLTINIASALTGTERQFEQDTSFESIAEEPEALSNYGFPFQETKRKAGCCSIFTYWYANSLVDSVELNNGKMDKVFIETMNNDPKRDENLLAAF